MLSDKDLKNIYEYMSQTKCDWQLDSNSAWEVVKEMGRRGDTDSYINHAGDLYVEEGYIMDTISDTFIFITWLMNPTNFFNCFAKWLEEREESK